MAEMCPQCGKRTDLEIGERDLLGWQKYRCLACEYEWKSTKPFVWPPDLRQIS
ncbi:hypothetical protein [Nocardia sp. BMG51109]|uniref:hypothetical protein n=1 Tax=Nocardia sp. BMG51109 TaxID=1056816 RepID=UPI0004BC137B|nr:hypothetical protein [Nocardia sp. BMG51109]